MKPSNYLDRKKQIIMYSGALLVASLVMVFCFYVTLVISEKGVGLIEKKQQNYNIVFKKQAELNFKTEELFKKLYNLKNKRRNPGEYRQLQKIISAARVDIRQEIDSTKYKNRYYAIYGQFLSQVREIQSLLDSYDKEVKTKEMNKNQLEICREQISNKIGTKKRE